jgi:catechol 2,3-dioxygenase-like lactoylglutathione lyase family enzyme
MTKLGAPLLLAATVAAAAIADPAPAQPPVEARLAPDSSKESPAMEPRISMITLGVEDLERSIRFYRDGLGLPMRPDTEGVAFFEVRGTWLGLFPRQALAEDAGVAESGEGFRSFSLAHNVRTREQVDRVLEAAAKAGATIVKPAADTFWGGYSGYFSDPDGFLWEVAWNPHFWVGPE